MPLFNSIICGDSLVELKKMPDEFVDLVITSPPYYALRNYQVDGQLGLEKTFEEYQEKLLAVIAEIKRVIKPTGQFWLNLGDIYGTGSGAGSRKRTKQATNTGSNYYEDKGKNPPGEQKCLMMMPERIALKMLDNGWILRNKIKWAKQILIKKENRTIGSVMPTSVKDRFNESGEELYFFVKNKKYYFDLDAVRMPAQTFEDREMGIKRQLDYPESKYNKFNYRVRDAKRKSGQPQFRASEEEIKRYNQIPEDYGKKKLQDLPDKGKNLNRWMSGTPNFVKQNARQKNAEKENMITLYSHSNRGKEYNNPAGKNLPTIWQIGSEPHNFQKELGVDVDHFATFPQALLEIPIKFGCPPGGIVLDPFSGSGTVALVARSLGINYLGIELSEKYIK